MKRSLTRLLASLHNTPMFVTSDYLDFACTFIAGSERANIQTEIKTADQESFTIVNKQSRIAVMSIDGPLTTVEHSAPCGPSPASYSKISAEASAVIKSGNIDTLVFDTNTPGGEAYRMIETATSIRQLADEYGVKLVTYVDGMAASAGYGIAAVSHEIVMNPEASVGSIGVVVRLMNTKAAMDKMGLKETYVYAGKSKIPFDENGEFTQAFLDEVQDRVSMMYERFTSHVSEYRNLDQQAVIDTEAKMFSAQDAINNGLADKIMTHSEFRSYIGLDEVKSKDKNGEKMSLEVEGEKLEAVVDTEALQQMQAQLTSLTEQVEAKESALQEAVAQAAQFKAAMEAAQAQVAEFKAAQEKAKVVSRQEQLKNAGVDADKIEALVKSTESLDTEAFESIVSVMSAKSKEVEQSALFQELGVDGDVEEEKKESGLQAAIKQLYNVG